MAQARLSGSQIAERANQIDRLEAAINRWKILSSKEAGLDVLREAIQKAIAVEEKQQRESVKTLSFSSDLDKLTLAKSAGRLEFANSIYYDISVTESSKKIDSAHERIAQLSSEIKRAKAGELIEVGENI